VIKKQKTMSRAKKEIARGYTGKIYHPSSLGPDFVMKLSTKPLSLHSIKIAKYIQKQMGKDFQTQPYFYLPLTDKYEWFDKKTNIGTFIPYGKEFDLKSITKEDKEHLTKAVQLLHSLRVTHNDIQPYNLVRGLKDGKPRIIDWEMAAIHNEPNQFFGEQVPMMTGRLFYTVFTGQYFYNEEQQRKFDWDRLKKNVFV